jgi:hypothetical protein
MALRIVERDRDFEMFSGRKERAHEIRGRAPRHPRVYQAHWIVRGLCPAQKLFGNFSGPA